MILIDSSCILPADPTLSLRLQRCKHDDHRVVPGRSSDKTPKLVSIHFDDGTFGAPFHHLGHLLRQQSLHTTHTCTHLLLLLHYNATTKQEKNWKPKQS